MSLLNCSDLVSKDAAVRLAALAAWSSNLTRERNLSEENRFAALLVQVARFDPDPASREAVISMPQFPTSELTFCLTDPHPSVRKAAIKHPAMPKSAILRHLAFETNERVTVACLVALPELSEEDALEALGAKQSDAFAEGEFYAVLRSAVEHHSPAVRTASARPLATLLKSASESSTYAFNLLEQLLCDIPRVACATIGAMQNVSHPYKFSERVVRALIALSDTGERSPLQLLGDVPCKTILGYAFLEFWMERRVYNATGDEHRELDELFTKIVVRNETFARVLDLPRPVPDKQWFWRGEKQAT